MKAPDLGSAAVDDWCRRWLGAGEVLFTAGHLARVVGVRLTDGREVVVKVRPAAGRLAGCTDVQRALWEAGFPCPRPLAGPRPAGLRVYAFNAKKASLDGVSWLDPGEAAERLRRAGA
jgi:hypothetical protein